MRKSPMRLWIASAMLLSMSGCAGGSGTPDFCAIQPDVTPDPGFEARWTHEEKLQIEKLDEHLDSLCHRR